MLAVAVIDILLRKELSLPEMSDFKCWRLCFIDQVRFLLIIQSNKDCLLRFSKMIEKECRTDSGALWIFYIGINGTGLYAIILTCFIVDSTTAVNRNSVHKTRNIFC